VQYHQRHCQLSLGVKKSSDGSRDSDIQSQARHGLRQLVFIALCLTPLFPQIDITGAMLTAWMVRGESYQLCSVQYCAQQLCAVSSIHGDIIVTPPTFDIYFSHRGFQTQLPQHSPTFWCTFNFEEIWVFSTMTKDQRPCLTGALFPARMLVCALDMLSCTNAVVSA